MFIELIVPVTDFESLPLNSEGLRAFSDSLWEGVRSALHEYDREVYNGRELLPVSPIIERHYMRKMTDNQYTSLVYRAPSSVDAHMFFLCGSAFGAAQDELTLSRCEREFRSLVNGFPYANPETAWPYLTSHTTSEASAALSAVLCMNHMIRTVYKDTESYSMLGRLPLDDRWPDFPGAFYLTLDSTSAFLYDEIENSANADLGPNVSAFRPK
jgi:hypothetical protein